MSGLRALEVGYNGLVILSDLGLVLKEPIYLLPEHPPRTPAWHHSCLEDDIQALHGHRGYMPILSSQEKPVREV